MIIEIRLCWKQIPRIRKVSKTRHSKYIGIIISSPFVALYLLDTMVDNLVWFKSHMQPFVEQKSFVCTPMLVRTRRKLNEIQVSWILYITLLIALYLACFLSYTTRRIITRLLCILDWFHILHAFTRLSQITYSLCISVLDLSYTTFQYYLIVIVHLKLSCNLGKTFTNLYFPLVKNFLLSLSY